MNFNYEERTVNISEDGLIHWIAMLHGILVDCGAWDKLVVFDTETAQQLEILAEQIER